jgi:hypothetical protein
LETLLGRIKILLDKIIKIHILKHIENHKIMTKETLAMIVAENFEKAKHGDVFAISAVIGAQEELKKIEELEDRIAQGNPQPSKPVAL